MKKYEDLLVWQRSIELAVTVYRLTKSFPKEEIFGLVSQMRRAAVSIASNIAEGSKRSSDKDFANFVRIAQGSGAEVETQLLIAHKVGYINSQEYNLIKEEILVIMKMLSSLLKTLQN